MKGKITFLKIAALSVATFLAVGTRVNAQIEVTPDQTADSLAKTLVGEGVIMLNPVLNCHSGASGTFAGMGGNMGIDSGVVLTSGGAVLAEGPNTGGGGPAQGNGSPGDPDLNSILAGGTTTYDACILEFDFVPAGDTVKFDYIFASSEYQGFSCSSFNDVFGFLISGPGYASPFNMATIPGTSYPICVNSTTGVTSGGQCNNYGPESPYSEYYVDNINGPILSYSGFTTIFTAIASVSPCDTYHLKLAIADGSDGTLDSGVFLKAGSLNSIGLNIGGETGGGQPDVENHAVRGCKPGKFIFNTLQPQPAPLTIHFDLGGSATIGDDYAFIPDSVVIPTGETSAEVIIHALHNGYYNGPEDVTVSVYSPYLCGNGNPNVIATATMMIYDSLYATPAITPAGICPGDSVLLTEDIANGLTIHWSPSALAGSPDSTSTWVHPTAPTMFLAEVNQEGAPSTCPSVERYFFVHVDPIPNIVIPDEHLIICLTDSVDLPVDVLPDSMEYTFLWTPADGLQSPTAGYNRFYMPVGSYDYVIAAYSPLGCEGTQDMHIDVVPPFTFTDISPDTTIYYGDEIQLRATGGMLYQWSPPRWILYPNEPTPLVAPLETTTYTVVGINEYGCRDTADVKVTVEYRPEEVLPSAFSPNGDGLNDRFRIENLGEEKILQFTIFNRWGQQVYDDPGSNLGWDGTYEGRDAPLDVYSYVIRLSSPQGYVRTMKGTVTLVR